MRRGGCELVTGSGAVVAGVKKRGVVSFYYLTEVISDI